MRTLKRLMEAILPVVIMKLIGFLYGYVTKIEKSYSQKGEDLLLKSYFDHKKIKHGFYLDIGCFHPRWISNTHKLHKAGWNGVAIDIDKFKLKAMKIMRGESVKTILGAVGNCATGNFGTIYKFNRIWSDIDTLDKSTAEQYKLEGRGEYSEETIEILNINSILEKCEHVNLINIDVEGIDHLIVNNIDFKKYLPDVILFEDNRNWGGNIETQLLLKKQGYELLFISAGSVCYAIPPKTFD